MGELSEKAFPFDTDVDDLGNYDREYFADDFARYFRKFISSGTFMGVADNLQIIANGDMTVTLRPGSMNIDGYGYDNVADIIIPIEPADGVVNRIDRISITWMNEERDIHKTVQKGTPSYVPAPPECRRNEEYKDYVLADIYIPAGAIGITQDMITDQRLNSEVCGLAIAFSNIDTTMIFDQLQAFYQKVVAESTEWKQEKKDAFETWFESVKNTLSGDVAGNLLEQIGVLENLATESKDNLVNSINEVVGQTKDNILETMEEIEANTELGKYAGANAIKELNNNLAPQYPDYAKVTVLTVTLGIDNNHTFVAEEDGFIHLMANAGETFNAVGWIYGNIDKCSFSLAGARAVGSTLLLPVKKGDTITYRKSDIKCKVSFIPTR